MPRFESIYYLTTFTIICQAIFNFSVALISPSEDEFELTGDVSF